MANSEYMMDGENLGRSLSGVDYVLGVIPYEAELRFNRMIYRISRGYAITRSVDHFKFPGLE